jgi:diguanylate cyclase (GGDEF)-like protein
VLRATHAASVKRALPQADCQRWQGGAVTASVGKAWPDSTWLRDAYSGAQAQVRAGKITLTPAPGSEGILLLEPVKAEASVPFSWENATVYFALTDRFNNGNPHNDLYGHNEGDKAIKAVASLMTKCTAEGGICSRFGGDEFVAVIAETDGADSFYEKISRSIAEYNRRSKSPYDVSISCGYKAGKPKTLKEIDDLMKASDREMYTQKRKHHSRRD